MPMQTPKVRGSNIKEYDVTIDKFNKGYVSLLDESRLPEAEVGLFHDQNQNLEDEEWIQDSVAIGL